MRYAKQIPLLGISLALLAGTAGATGDAIPQYSGQTSSFTVTVIYAREWEYAAASNPVRNDGPMLVVTPSAQIGPVGHQVASLYYLGNADMLKFYQSVLLSAQASKRQVTFKWGDKWCKYKNVLDDADLTIAGATTGLKLLELDLAP